MLVCYLSLVYFTKNRLISNSKLTTLNQQKQIKLIQETLGSIKDIFIFNSKDIYLKNYLILIEKLESTSQNLFLNTFPRYAIESLAIFILTTISLFFRNESDLIKIPNNP